EEPSAAPATKSKPSGSLLSSSRLLTGRVHADGSTVDFMPAGGAAGPSSGSTMMIPMIPGPSGASRKASQASSAARFSPALPPLHQQQQLGTGMSAVGSCEIPAVLVAAQPGDIRLEDMRPPGEENNHPGPSSLGPISSPEASPAHQPGADRQPLMGGRASTAGIDGRKPLAAGGRDLNLDLETRPGGPVELKLPPKKKPPSKDDLQDLDWWSRFYATIDDLEDQDFRQKIKPGTALLSFAVGARMMYSKLATAQQVILLLR
uniref:BSD domain-containing protein n=1 Tax=Macrostomum lignano TaxID=282301 RepID=A0A1I8HBP3_9PLAT